MFSSGKAYLRHTQLSLLHFNRKHAAYNAVAVESQLCYTCRHRHRLRRSILKQASSILRNMRWRSVSVGSVPFNSEPRILLQRGKKRAEKLSPRNQLGHRGFHDKHFPRCPRTTAHGFDRFLGRCFCENSCAALSFLGACSKLNRDGWRQLHEQLANDHTRPIFNQASGCNGWHRWASVDKLDFLEHYRKQPWTTLLPARLIGDTYVAGDNAQKGRCHKPQRLLEGRRSPVHCGSRDCLHGFMAFHKPLRSTLEHF